MDAQKTLKDIQERWDAALKRHEKACTEGERAYETYQRANRERLAATQELEACKRELLRLMPRAEKGARLFTFDLDGEESKND